MKKYYILPKKTITEEIESISKEDALPDFAARMDSDMNEYFIVSETIMQRERENRHDNIVFSPLVINPSLFNIYMRKNKLFKDGTYDWELGLELKSNCSQYMILDRIHGTGEEVIIRLEEILINGK